MHEKGRGPTVVFSGGGTGGHLYPALALADALVARRPDVVPYFIGAERGIEARILPERGVPHHLVSVRGLRRSGVLGNVGVLFQLGRALLDVRERFRALEPALVVVTGGYAAAPAGLAAAVSSIPLLLQEQNALPGRTSRLLGRFADHAYVAFEEAVPRLPARMRSRTTQVGNPVRALGAASRAEGRRTFGLPADEPVVLVMGGSQGSRALNEIVLDLVRRVEEGSERPAALHLLWASGPDHHESVRAALAALGSPTWVHAVAYIEDVDAALAAADLAVSRAGAMTTAEYFCRGLPSVLVPLPTAAEDHQTSNARAIEAAGAAVHAPQSDLDGSRLLRIVETLLTNPGRLSAMAARALERADPRAAARVAEDLDARLREREGGTP